MHLSQTLNPKRPMGVCPMHKDHIAVGVCPMHKDHIALGVCPMHKDHIAMGVCHRKMLKFANFGFT